MTAIYADDEDLLGYEVACAYKHIIGLLRTDRIVEETVGGRIVSELVREGRRGSTKYPLILVQDTGEDDDYAPNGRDAVAWTTVRIQVQLVTTKPISRSAPVLAAITRTLQDTEGDNEYGTIIDCYRSDPAGGAERDDSGQEWYYYGHVYELLVQAA